MRSMNVKDKILSFFNENPQFSITSASLLKKTGLTKNVLLSTLESLFKDNVLRKIGHFPPTWMLVDTITNNQNDPLMTDSGDFSSVNAVNFKGCNSFNTNRNKIPSLMLNYQDSSVKHLPTTASYTINKGTHRSVPRPLMQDFDIEDNFKNINDSQGSVLHPFDSKSYDITSARVECQVRSFIDQEDRSSISKDRPVLQVSARQLLIQQVKGDNAVRSFRKFEEPFTQPLSFEIDGDINNIGIERLRKSLPQPLMKQVDQDDIRGFRKFQESDQQPLMQQIDGDIEKVGIRKFQGSVPQSLMHQVDGNIDNFGIGRSKGSFPPKVHNDNDMRDFRKFQGCVPKPLMKQNNDFNFEKNLYEGDFEQTSYQQRICEDSSIGSKRFQTISVQPLMEKDIKSGMRFQESTRLQFASRGNDNHGDSRYQSLIPPPLMQLNSMPCTVKSSLTSGCAKRPLPPHLMMDDHLFVNSFTKSSCRPSFSKSIELPSLLGMPVASHDDMEVRLINVLRESGILALRSSEITQRLALNCDYAEKINSTLFSLERRGIVHKASDVPLTWTLKNYLSTSASLLGEPESIVQTNNVTEEHVLELLRNTGGLSMRVTDLSRRLSMPVKLISLKLFSLSLKGLVRKVADFPPTWCYCSPLPISTN